MRLLWICCSLLVFICLSTTQIPHGDRPGTKPKASAVCSYKWPPMSLHRIISARVWVRFPCTERTWFCSKWIQSTKWKYHPSTQIQPETVKNGGEKGVSSARVKTPAEDERIELGKKRKPFTVLSFSTNADISRLMWSQATRTFYLP